MDNLARRGQTAVPDGTRPEGAREAMAAGVGACLAAIRAQRPRIHAITSPVAQSLTANGLLALGATPSLSVNPDEIDGFVLSSQGLLLNLGMMDRDRLDAIPRAAAAARRAGLPFVLDPVFADRAPARRALAQALIVEGPGIVKLNSAEAGAFAEIIPVTTARVITGASDSIELGTQRVLLGNGHPLMARVTAMGCLLGAVLAACHAVEPDRFRAAIAGVSLLNIAAEQAAAKASGPGTFAALLIDALDALQPDEIRTHLKLEARP
jgi:hydroxyethylthiazole kinase